MGVYFNPNNESFTQARNSMVYVDKTGLIEMLNQRLSTEDKCIAVSHAHLMIFPAIVISLLMICFNLFGNGLRDAFNPSLRGVED